MKAFAELYTQLDETNKTGEKVDALVRYFASADLRLPQRARDESRPGPLTACEALPQSTTGRRTARQTCSRTRPSTSLTPHSRLLVLGLVQAPGDAQ